MTTPLQSHQKALLQNKSQRGRKKEHPIPPHHVTDRTSHHTCATCELTTGRLNQHLLSQLILSSPKLSI